MANNITVKDGASANVVLKTTDNSGVQTPHYNVDSVPDLGDTTDTVATDDTGNFSLIALVKRGLQTLTSISGLLRPTVLAVSGSTSSLTSTPIAAPGSGLSIYLIGYVLQNESTVATLMQLSDGSDKARILGQTQGDGLPFMLPFPLKLATNTALTLTLDSANQCGYTIYYYVA